MFPFSRKSITEIMAGVETRLNAESKAAKEQKKVEVVSRKALLARHTAELKVMDDSIAHQESVIVAANKYLRKLA